MSRGECNGCEAELRNGQGACEACVELYENAAFERGMCVLQAIQDWALAIQANGPRCPSKREYWTSGLDGKLYYNCFCARCEFRYLKALEAGVDEGTDYELCGDCRY